MAIDHETKDWIRCAADEKAAANGCRFDEGRAKWTIDWIQNYCRLYEGEFAGQPLILQDWQLEAVSRLFGWVRYSDDWKREIRRFRRGGVWVPKKNKKSPTLAAIGLYLLCGDGEQGQKVFGGAKDGGQAMIAHQHAMEMVRRSPALAEECSINKSTGRITHEPSRSFYSVVAGDNIKSQEGLNGSVLIDETHVVDAALMKVLEGAGISRSEPLHLEFSTAGNNPDGYGRAQFDYGKRVEKGEVEDEGFFFLAYHAPLDLSDEALDKNLMEIGKAANPAWGHTIKPSEFAASYNAAKHSTAKLSTFKMYRLNIWQKTSNPWLRSGDWDRCAANFSEDDLAGRMCYASFDLSKTRDMSALALIFPEGDDEWNVLPYFWMPEEAAREHASMPFMQWAKQGHLMLTPGSVMDYGYIGGTFRRLAKKFNIRELAYDPRFAEELTQRLEQGAADDTGKIIEEGTGVTRVAVMQTSASLHQPTEEFERAVIAGKFHHNNHPILSWQAGHVEVKVHNKLKQLVKPGGKDDVRKIDGIAAIVTGMARVMVGGTGESVYTQRARAGQDVLLTI